MYQAEDILEAARSIRPYLSNLLNTSEAEVIDQQLASLLAQAVSKQPVENSILEILASQDATREWMLNFLQDKQQPDPSRTWNPLAGRISAVDADKFVCPQGDYIWHRHRVGVEPPLCPTHYLPLKLS